MYVIFIVFLLILILCFVFMGLIHSAVSKEYETLQEKEINRILGIIDDKHTLLSSFSVNKHWILHCVTLNTFIDVSVYCESGVLVVDIKDAETHSSDALIEDLESMDVNTDKRLFPICVSEPGAKVIQANASNVELAKKYSTCQVSPFTDVVDCESYYHYVFTPELDNQVFRPVRYVLICPDEDLLMQSVTIFGKSLSDLFFPKKLESEV